MLRQILQAHNGWEVCAEAATGREAVEKAAALKPDVIVLDLSMPIMDGLEAASQILWTNPDMPIVLFTNHMYPTLEAEAARAGIRRVLSKDGISLLDTLEAVLNEKLHPAMETIQSEISSPQTKTKLPKNPGNN